MTASKEGIRVCFLRTWSPWKTLRKDTHSASQSFFVNFFYFPTQCLAFLLIVLLKILPSANPMLNQWKHKQPWSIFASESLSSKHTGAFVIGFPVSFTSWFLLVLSCFWVSQLLTRFYHWRNRKISHFAGCCSWFAGLGLWTQSFFASSTPPRVSETEFPHQSLWDSKWSGLQMHNSRKTKWRGAWTPAHW